MLGLWFAKKPVTHEVLTKGVTDTIYHWRQGTE